MFKSVKWKISLMFTLCVAAAITVICAFHTYSLFRSCKNEFTNAIYDVFTDEFIAEIEAAAKKAEYTVTPTDDNGVIVNQQMNNNIKDVYDMVSAKSGALGLNANRYLAVIDPTGNPIFISNDNIKPENIEKTPVITNGLSGEGYINTSYIKGYMDYSCPFTPESGGKYLIYIHDNKAQAYELAVSLLKTYLNILALTFILSLFAGAKISTALIFPLRRLNESARKLAAGDSDPISHETGKDEIGQLAKTMLELSHSLDVSATQMKNEKTKLETILQNMTDGILAFDAKGKLIHFNPEAQRLLGRTYLDDINFDSFFKEINANITMGDLLYIKNEGGTEREVTLNKDRVVTMNFAAFTLDNKVGGIVVVMHDITKQEKLEQSRRDFVADVSHELRTPITTIKSYSETLADNPDTDRELQSRFLRVVSSEANRMTRIISDLLTLSELDNKHHDPKAHEPIDIRKMIESIIERLEITAAGKKQTLLYSPINDVPAIDGDRDGLERVFINIINNAIKYTQSGGRIDVFTSCVYNDICVKITDNGIGIPEENLPHIFDRFYRVDKARSRDTGGTGLGLAIAKQIIESSFHGKIIINSQLNKGTEVIITIPLPGK